VMAVFVSACTSVTEVMVTPEQLHDLAGLEPDQERAFAAEGHSKPLVARGDDEARLLVRPGHIPGTPGEPWVKLYNLRWAPDDERAANNRDVELYAVPAANLAGADVRISRVDTALTLALVAGILVGTVAAGLALSALALSQIHTTVPGL
jgi:hypothetical protein